MSLKVPPKYQDDASRIATGTDKEGNPYIEPGSTTREEIRRDLEAAGFPPAAIPDIMGWVPTEEDTEEILSDEYRADQIEQRISRESNMRNRLTRDIAEQLDISDEIGQAVSQARTKEEAINAARQSAESSQTIVTDDGVTVSTQTEFDSERAEQAARNVAQDQGLPTQSQVDNAIRDEMLGSGIQASEHIDHTEIQGVGESQASQELPTITDEQGNIQSVVGAGKHVDAVADEIGVDSVGVQEYQDNLDVVKEGNTTELQYEDQTIRKFN